MREAKADDAVAERAAVKKERSRQQRSKDDDNGTSDGAAKKPGNTQHKHNNDHRAITDRLFVCDSVESDHRPALFFVYAAQSPARHPA